MLTGAGLARNQIMLQWLPTNTWQIGEFCWSGRLKVGLVRRVENFHFPTPPTHPDHIYPLHESPSSIKFMVVTPIKFKAPLANRVNQNTSDSPSSQLKFTFSLPIRYNLYLINLVYIKWVVPEYNAWSFCNNRLKTKITEILWIIYNIKYSVKFMRDSHAPHQWLCISKSII